MTGDGKGYLNPASGMLIWILSSTFQSTIQKRVVGRERGKLNPLKGCPKHWELILPCPHGWH